MKKFMKKLLIGFIALGLFASVCSAVQLGQGLGDKFDSVSVGTTEVVSNISTGVYTPVLSGGSNVAASTAYPLSWVRVGNSVTCSFLIAIDPTSAAPTITSINFTLPFACSTTPTGNGCAWGDSTASQGGTIGMISSTNAQYSYFATNVANAGHQGIFQYRIN